MKRSEFNFYAGCFIGALVHMAIQDWHGLEGYIDNLRENWIPIPFWLDAVLILIASVIVGAIDSKYEAAERKRQG